MGDLVSSSPGACNCPPAPAGIDRDWWVRMWQAGQLGGGMPGCAPSHQPIPMGADGCPEARRVCKTPVAIGGTVPLGGTLTVNIPTVGEGRSYIRQIIVVSASVAIADIDIQNMRQAGQEYLPNGAIPAEAYLRSGDDDANLAPAGFFTTASVAAQIVWSNANAANQVVRAFAMLDEVRA